MTISSERPAPPIQGTVTSGDLAVLVKVGPSKGPQDVTLQDAGNVSAIYLPNLPTSDPHVVGQLWNSSGVLTVSAG